MNIISIEYLISIALYVVRYSKCKNANLLLGKKRYFLERKGVTFFKKSLVTLISWFRFLLKLVLNYTQFISSMKMQLLLDSANVINEFNASASSFYEAFYKGPSASRFQCSSSSSSRSRVLLLLQPELLVGLKPSAQFVCH